MAKRFSTIENYNGYRTKVEETNAPARILVDGSQNMLFNDEDKIATRKGFTLDGAADSTRDPILGSFDWNTNTGDERNLRSFDDTSGSGSLQFRFVDGTTITWTDVKTDFTNADLNFTTWWDDGEQLDILIFVNGTADIHAWSGCTEKIGVTTGSTIQLLTTTDTWAERRVLKNTGVLTYDKKLTISGTEFTYTGGETTNTLTGVTPDPSGLASGSLAVQTVTTFTNAPGSDATTFPNDFVSTLRNQIYVGSEINRVVFVSKNTSFIDFTFTATRLPGEGAELTLDNSAVGFAPQQEDMYITAGKDDWYRTRFTLSSGNTAEELTVRKLKTAPQQAAQSRDLIWKIKNNVVFISNEPTLDQLGDIEDVITPQSRPLSDPIKPDFNNADFTNGMGIYFKNQIFISAPVDGVIYIYDIDKGYWQPPQLLPIRRFAVIDGELFGHSSAVTETFKLFDGTNDNSNIIQHKAVFSYRNFGTRSNLKEFDEYFTEGFISSNTDITLRLKYEFKGFESIQEFLIKGDDDSILFSPPGGNSLGKQPLGKDPLGSSVDEPDILSKFRQIDTMNTTAFYEMQVEYETDDDDAQFEILSHGPNARASTIDNIHIKK